MPLNLEQKKELVKEVSDVLLNADTILTADYRGSVSYTHLTLPTKA